MLPVRNWYCSGKRETGVFPIGKPAIKKRKEGRKEMKEEEEEEKNILLRADCKFRAEESMTSESLSIFLLINSAL